MARRNVPIVKDFMIVGQEERVDFCDVEFNEAADRCRCRVVTDETL
jgi:hypothetical protein